jgi:hypothetical protein
LVSACEALGNFDRVFQPACQESKELIVSVGYFPSYQKESLPGVGLADIRS